MSDDQTNHKSPGRGTSSEKSGSRRERYITLTQAEILALDLIPAEAIPVYRNAKWRRRFRAAAGQPAGTFTTGFQAWAHDLGMSRQALHRFASGEKGLRSAGLLNWDGKRNQRAVRTFWLPLEPPTSEVLGELGCQPLVDTGTNEDAEEEQLQIDTGATPETASSSKQSNLSAPYHGVSGVNRGKHADAGRPASDSEPRRPAANLYLPGKRKAKFKARLAAKIAEQHDTLKEFLEDGRPRWWNLVEDGCRAMRYEIDVNDPLVSADFACAIANTWEEHADENLPPGILCTKAIDRCREEKTYWPPDRHGVG